MFYKSPSARMRLLSSPPGKVALAKWQVAGLASALGLLTGAAGMMIWFTH